MGDIVNSTDDNLEDFKNMSSDVGRQLTQLAGETGISRETLVQIAGTLEEIQDKGEDFDMSVITDEFARIELSGSDAERAALKVGEETATAAGKAGDAQAIWLPLRRGAAQLGERHPMTRPAPTRVWRRVTSW